MPDRGTLNAARARAAAHVDGEVSRAGRGFEVTLRLVASDGRRLGLGRGRGTLLHEAVHAALDELGTAGSIPVLSVDPEVARWTFAATPALGIFFDEVEHTMSATLDRADMCRRVAARRADVGPDGPS